MGTDADPGPDAAAPDADPTSVLALALAIVEAEGTALPAVPGTRRREVAWKLKDLCYEAWRSEPSRAARLAAALRRLSLHHETREGATREEREIEAIADWTDGIAGLTRGEMAAASACFVRSSAIFRELGDDRHAAQTQVPNIVALSMLGRHAQAAECAERTQREFVAHGDVGAAGKVSLNLGSLHLRRDDFEKAADHYRQAAVLFARIGDREHSVMADIGLAGALSALGDFDEAVRIHARAAMRARTYRLPVLEAIVQESVALLDLVRGRYREALAGFEGSRRRYEDLGMRQNLAIAEKQLADAYLELHLMPEALALFDKALTEFRSLGMTDDEAWTLAQRGRLHAMRGDATAAAESLLTAGAVFATQGNHVGEAAVALARAELALRANDAGAALAHAESAAQAFAAANLPDRSAWAEVVRGEALLRAGDVERARAVLEATLARARELELLPVEVRCLTIQGLAAVVVGEVESARDAFRAAVELFEEMRRALPGDEIRSAFLSDHLRPYEELLRMSLEEGARDGSTASAVATLRQLDLVRARTLGERMAGGKRPDAGADTVDLRTRLNWLYRRVRQLQEEGSPSAVLVAELRATEHELLERSRRRRLSLAGARPSVESDTDSLLDVGSLQAVLGEGDAIVEYGVSADELFACVVTRDGVCVQRRVAAWSAVVETVRSARFQIETLRHGAAPVSRHLGTLTKRARFRLQELHAMIWAPLDGKIAGCRRVLIVPHAELGALSFCALHDGEHYLAERREVAYAPSARVALRGLRRPAVPVARALVIGESSRLPHAAAEARAVGAIYPRADIFVGDEATLGALRAHSHEADVIHLACHAQFRTDNPMFSALYLADGALTVEATEALSLRPGTVVLSACETALADEGTGDEMVGLVRAFLIAGAGRVVASLWPVDDEITFRFMTLFHGALNGGITPAAALRRAQLEVMRDHPHPFHWAAFALNGRW